MNADATVIVLYSCNDCGISQRQVQVREREDDEEITHWVQWTVDVINVDHDRISPDCAAITVDVTYPVIGPNARVGQVTRQ